MMVLLVKTWVIWRTLQGATSYSLQLLLLLLDIHRVSCSCQLLLPSLIQLNSSRDKLQHVPASECSSGTVPTGN